VISVQDNQKYVTLQKHDKSEKRYGEQIKHSLLALPLGFWTMCFYELNDFLFWISEHRLKIKLNWIRFIFQNNLFSVTQLVNAKMPQPRKSSKRSTGSTSGSGSRQSKQQRYSDLAKDSDQDEQVESFVNLIKAATISFTCL
jgi:hypothetical protein